MTNERDDEILGRALSRAIETLDAEETPYESSRIGVQSVRRGTPFWRVAALAASIVLAGALGATLLDRPAADPQVGQQPTATVAPNASATPGPSATPTPAPTVTPQPNAIDHDRIFFARDGLAPVSAHISSTVPATAEASKRIARRMAALLMENAATPPAGSTNARPPLGTITSRMR